MQCILYAYLLIRMVSVWSSEREGQIQEIYQVVIAPWDWIEIVIRLNHLKFVVCIESSESEDETGRSHRGPKS